jgi:hypothetical protein
MDQGARVGAGLSRRSAAPARETTANMPAGWQGPECFYLPLPQFLIAG